MSDIKKTKKIDDENMDKQYYIVRCDRAGVFFGQIKARLENEVVMQNVRKLWYWDGAFAVEQLAVDGTSEPDNCKFTVTVDEMTVMGPVEIIPCTEKATKSIKAVKEWKIQTRK